MDLYWSRNGTGHDLLFVNGECPTTHGRVDSIEQKLYIRLRTFMGEWYLNVDYGVPWLDILGSRVRKSTVDMIIQKEILKESGVERITSFKSSLNRRTREYDCSFVVKTDQGTLTPIITVDRGI